ncbi:ly6/PLAUR domain-containing protein 1-like [Cynoglossus semilaevis]|uniref:LY6/PLAUR domain containing 1 n=1 Tax=Cynoglossus semilaevis TaxID=244447 RepID=A0A3P8UQB9_CYNSE|nr:ly6/PLAUR domain-containing protein 1-like [Cynoglossus semilaevis]
MPLTLLFTGHTAGVMCGFLCAVLSALFACSEKLSCSNVSTHVVWERMRLLFLATFFGVLLDAGNALQIQCYQCDVKHNDCSTPEYVVNCTVNVQDMCQKEVLVKPDGVHYRKSCASSGACLIASSGYQQFCTGRLNSVCITCCNTPLCNGLKKKRPAFSSSPSLFQKLNNSLHFLMTTSLLPMMLLT